MGEWLFRKGKVLAMREPRSARFQLIGLLPLFFMLDAQFSRAQSVSAVVGAQVENPLTAAPSPQAGSSSASESVVNPLATDSLNNRQTFDYQNAMASAVRRAAEQCLDSVVSIEVIGGVGAGIGEVERDAPSSGVIVDSSGFILSSSLVSSRPSASLIVVLSDGTRHAARVISSDQHRDLVLLKIDGVTKLKPMQFAKQQSLAVGQSVIAVGRYGEDNSPLVSRGILSAVQRLDGIALQCDARVSPSFYGGPLIDLYGRNLGILIPAVAEGGAESSTSWYDSGIAFAIPSDVIARKLDRMKQGETIKKGVIGIVGKSSDPYAEGTQIAAVRRRSPAEAAGLQVGDEVIQVAGVEVRRQLDIRQALGPHDAGETISISYRRGDELGKVEVTLADSIPPLDPQRLGLLLSNSTEVDGGLLVDDVLPISRANSVFQQGDIIVGVDELKLENVSGMRQLLITSAPKSSLKVTVLRDMMKEVLTITTESVSGDFQNKYPGLWSQAEAADWSAKQWKLPEAGNEAAVVAPGENAGGGKRLGLLLLLMNPGEGSPQALVESWQEAAEESGVIVCAVAAEDQQRWLPKEIDIVTRFAASLIKQYPIASEAVAIGTTGALWGGDGNAADAMAMAVALSKRKIFHGVSVSTKAQPPRIRLPENQGEDSFQLMLSAKASADLPEWTAALTRAGYPVVTGGEVDQAALLHWVRLLQAL